MSQDKYPHSQEALNAIQAVEIMNERAAQNHSLYQAATAQQLAQQYQYQALQLAAAAPTSPSTEFVFDIVMAGVEKHLRRIIREELARDREEELTRLAIQGG